MLPPCCQTTANLQQPNRHQTALYINLKNSENLSRAGALGRRYPCYPIRAKIRRLGMGDQESIRQSLKSQEDKAFFHQVKCHVFLRKRAQKAKLLNSTRYIFISSM